MKNDIISDIVKLYYIGVCFPEKNVLNIHSQETPNCYKYTYYSAFDIILLYMHTFTLKQHICEHVMCVYTHGTNICGYTNKLDKQLAKAKKTSKNP